GIVKKKNIFASLKNAIKQISIHRILMFGCWQTVCLSYTVRHIRIFASKRWERSFIEGKNENIFKVQISCLQNTHDLQPLERFATKRYSESLNELTKQPQEGFQRFD